MPHIANRREPVDSLPRGRACCPDLQAQKGQALSLSAVGLTFQGV